MLNNPTAGRRVSGRLMVVLAVGVALPLTATRAINYVDVPVPAMPLITAAPAAPAAAAAPTAPAAPMPPAEPVEPLMVDGSMITIDGKSKKWSALTPEEKAEVRRSIAHAREELARTRIDREEIQREIREAMDEVRVDQDELRRDLAEAQADLAEAMQEIDAHSAEIRRAGQNPEQLKATIRMSMKAVEKIDVERITREALASIDPRQIEASVAAAEAAIRATEAELDKIEAFEDDD
jgi:hypothetical protein